MIATSKKELADCKEKYEEAKAALLTLQQLTDLKQQLEGEF